LKPTVAGFGTAVALALTLVWAPPGNAWKPYTHSYSGQQAWNDVTDDGKVTIDGREYEVRPEIVNALRRWPQYYNAGVIGPDGFPDLTYGQSVIHPVHTGEWLRLVYTKAWQAQSDPRYNANQREQILAFGYGFLTHAAGDMWGHTLVNDLSDPSGEVGVFPSVGEILDFSDLAPALLAVRHIVAEGYIGTATPGWDTNPDRGPAPGGDVSDRDTPGIPFQAPNQFLYETLIDPTQPTPWDTTSATPRVVDTSSIGTAKDARGPLLGFFLAEQAWVRSQLSPTYPGTLADAMSHYDAALDAIAAMQCDCNFGTDTPGCTNACDDACVVLPPDFTTCSDACDAAHDVGACIYDTFDAFGEFVQASIDLVQTDLWQAYLYAWDADLDAGLRNWGDFGLALTQGLFDPQARRDCQNATCEGAHPDESSVGRATCEGGVNTLDVVLFKTEPFIRDRMLSMAGAPDFVGDLIEFVERISDFLDDVLNALGEPFAPLRDGIDAIKAWIKDQIRDAISEALGIDIEQIEQFARDPYRLTCDTSLQLTLPGRGTVTLPSLFPSGTHEKIDQIMGIAPDHHVPIPPLPDDCGRLEDGVKFDLEKFAPLRNTVTTAKLLLLDGDGMDRVLTDILGRQISTYGPNDNIMFTSLQGSAWLELIDGDHSWRKDGAPKFGPRPKAITAGTGQFPIWESCVLRPAFRELYHDWENGPANFPDLGDEESADTVNDPNAPASTLTRTGTSYASAGVTYVAADHAFTHVAHDLPVDRAFRDDELGLRHRITADGAAPGAYVETAQGVTFTITGDDGPYTVEAQSEDHCHPYDGTGAKSPESPVTQQVVLDTHPPVVTCASPPFGGTHTTDETFPAAVTIDDGAHGSGVASQAGTIDGYRTATGVVSLEPNATIDAYQLWPGLRTVTVTATDHLGNSGRTRCTFEVHATVGSLTHNVERAYAEHSISIGLNNSLLAKLRAAQAAQDAGQVRALNNILGAVVHELEAQSGKAIDAELAARFIAWVQDLTGIGS